MDIDDEPTVSVEDRDGLTRRGFLGRSAALAGTATFVGGATTQAARALAAGGFTDAAYTPVALTGAQLATLKAVLAELLPKDSLGPGAVEAGVHVYIDRALHGSYKALLPLYQEFLPLFDKAAAAMGAKSFSGLSASQRVALLERFEAGTPPGVSASEAASVASDFQLLLEHMREGMFGDPMYGGNRRLAGWELIGFPDIILSPTVKDQAVGTKVKPTRKTAKTFGGTPYNGPGI